jgi:hypothetical protein
MLPSQLWLLLMLERGVIETISERFVKDSFIGHLLNSLTHHAVAATPSKAIKLIGKIPTRRSSTSWNPQ